MKRACPAAHGRTQDETFEVGDGKDWAPLRICQNVKSAECSDATRTATERRMHIEGMGLKGL